MRNFWTGGGGFDPCSGRPFPTGLVGVSVISCNTRFHRSENWYNFMCYLIDAVLNRSAIVTVISMVSPGIAQLHLMYDKSR